jgi:hypothetical protein
METEHPMENVNWGRGVPITPASSVIILISPSEALHSASSRVAASRGQRIRIHRQLLAAEAHPQSHAQGSVASTGGGPSNIQIKALKLHPGVTSWSKLKQWANRTNCPEASNAGWWTCRCALMDSEPFWSSWSVMWSVVRLWRHWALERFPISPKHGSSFGQLQDCLCEL